MSAFIAILVLIVIARKLLHLLLVGKSDVANYCTVESGMRGNQSGRVIDGQSVDPDAVRNLHTQRG